MSYGGPATLAEQDVYFSMTTGRGDKGVALFAAAGATTIEGSGSRVRFVLHGVVATFHRPHPAKEAKRYQVRDARPFLEQAGVKP